MTRTDARELLMQMLYSMKIQNDFSEDAKKSFLAEKNLKDQLEYFNKMYQLITENLEEIDGTYESLDTGWKINRISNVDLAIFRIAIAEMLYMDDIDKSISINEAVELAKKFSSDKSAKFINGVLAKIK